jgi:hypothetical protein
MACHPSGIVIDVVGIEANDHGRSCEQHECCGKAVIEVDVVVRIRAVQLERPNNEANPEKETTALAVYHVTGGIDSCRVGFLRRHLLRYADEYDGRLAQITEVFSDKSESPSDRAKHHRNVGCASAVLIEAEYRDWESPAKKKQKSDK